MTALANPRPDFMADFHRLAAPLRGFELDWNYHKTRKLLEPNWNGYDMPRNHDVIRDDVPIPECNLVTSHHRDDPDRHRIVLDLDYGVTTQPGLVGPTRLSLTRRKSATRVPGAQSLARRLNSFPLEATIVSHYVHLEPLVDYALIPSSTRGHYHLILAADMNYSSYATLLRLLNECGIIEDGYYRAFTRRGCSTIRPPWIRKPPKDTPVLF